MIMKSVAGVRSALTIGILIVVCCSDFSIGKPAEQPTKFSLNTGDAFRTLDSRLAAGLDQIQELLGRIADAIRIVTGRFVNSVTLARNIIADRAETRPSESQKKVARSDGSYQIQSSVEIQQAPLINIPPHARETVRLENETAQSLLERPVSKPISGVLESFLKPTPIVDGIREQDKYGNSGDKFIGLGRALVNGFEGFSNFLNAVVDFPRNAAKSTSRGLTEALNQIGAKLVGLE